jgi:LPXTG-motif cell wall-anchored protein
VNRVVAIARGRAGRVGLVAGLIAAGVFALAAPASAHNSAVSGSTSCSDGSHVVNWTIGNDDPLSMNIDSASAAIGAQSYAVTGYANPVSQAGTTASTIVPGGTNGTIVLTVHVTWTDHYSMTATAQVALQSNCSTTTTQATTTTTYPVTTTTQHHCDCESTTTTQPVTTTTQHHCECSTTTTQPVTTTTVADTTTTIADTTTTQPVTTTTSQIHELGSTTIVTTTTKPKATTTLAAAGTLPSTPTDAVLPHTGSSTTFPVIFGGLCLALGAGLALRKRSAWNA